jgi:PEGA domain
MAYRLFLKAWYSSVADIAKTSLKFAMRSKKKRLRGTRDSSNYTNITGRNDDGINVVQRSHIMKNVFISSAIGLALTVSGCASIANSTYTGYPISTTPAGAHVTVDGISFGPSPVLMQPDRRGSHLVRIEKDGCPTFDMMLSSRLNPWVFGNFLLGGPLGLIVDLGHASGYELVPERIDLIYGQENGRCVITGTNLVHAQQPARLSVAKGVEMGYVDNMSR